MTYLRVRWVHDIPDEPVELLSELDEARYEIRKVEIFREGRTGHADDRVSTNGTKLGDVPIASLSEIAADAQFVPEEITREEFETAWAAAHS